MKDFLIHTAEGRNAFYLGGIVVFAILMTGVALGFTTGFASPVSLFAEETPTETTETTETVTEETTTDTEEETITTEETVVEEEVTEEETTEDTGGTIEAAAALFSFKTSEPTPPGCPFSSETGRIIVKFDQSGKLLSHQGLSEAVTQKSASIPSGNYKISLASWDGYLDRVNVSQPNERYLVKFQNGSSVVASSNATTDLADHVVEATFEGVVNSSLSIGSGVNTVVAFHAVYPDTSSPNSVVPTCVALDPIEPPKESECKLEITKSVDKTTVTEGGEVVYTINFKNIGTANCTGGGVKVIDVVDSRLNYFGEQHSSNVSAGYQGAPVWSTSDRTLRWNAHDLTPGESGWVSWKAEAKPTQCSDIIPNKAKITALELNNFGTWIESNTVEVTATKDCGSSGPTCPFAPAPGRIIVNFDTSVKLVSHGSASQAVTSVNTNISRGTYKVSLASFDGYAERINVTQPHEQYLVKLEAAAVLLGTSNATPDLADFLANASFSGVVNDALTISADATKVTAAHAFYPDASSPNSVIPVCAAFDPPPPVETPACTLEANPTTLIAPATTSTLTWTTTNAVSASIDQSVGAVTPVAGGSTTVTPTASSTTYTLTAVGTNGQTVTCEKTITIPPPSTLACTLNASPNSFGEGGGTTELSWTTQHAVSFAIDQGIGSVTPVASGTTTDAITGDTTYVGTATSASGATVTCEAVVSVDTGGGGCTSGCGGGGGGRRTPRVVYDAAPSDPLASIYLSQVPYTGLDLGPVGTAMYWLMLILWSAAAAYLVLFNLLPYTYRRIRGFGASVSSLLGSSNAHLPAGPASTHAWDSDVPEAPRGYSEHDGFRSFAKDNALSIDDVVYGLARAPIAPAPVPSPVFRSEDPVVPPVAAYTNGTHAPHTALEERNLGYQVEPIYENVEPIYQNVEPIVPTIPRPAYQNLASAHFTANKHNVLDADVHGFLEALVGADKDAVFGFVRQMVRSGVELEQFLTRALHTLDDAFRARIEGSTCHPRVAAMTENCSTPTLERLIASLATAVDSSYSEGITGAKLALTRALAAVGN